MSAAGYPLQINGRFNPLAQKLSFTLLHGSTGRLYALDLGSDHHEPTCNRVGEKHKHVSDTLRGGLGRTSSSTCSGRPDTRGIH